MVSIFLVWKGTVQLFVLKIAVLIRGDFMLKRLADYSVIVVAMVILTILGTVVIVTLKPKHQDIWAGGLIIIVGLGAFIASRLLERRGTEKGISQRETLDDNTVYFLFYANSGLPVSLVTELWHEIADTMGVLPGKLRPTDRFGHEIGKSFWITNEALDALAAVATKRTKEYQSSIDLQLIKTVDDYIRQFSAMRKKP